MKKFEDILLITWIDTTSYAGWRDVMEVEHLLKDIKSRLVDSTGIYVGEDKGSILICQSLSKDVLGEMIQIPKILIHKMKSIYKITPSS